MKKVVSLIFIIMMVGCVFGANVFFKNGKHFNGHIRGKSDEAILLFDESINKFMKIYFYEIHQIYDEDGSDITEQTFAIDDFENNIDYTNIYTTKQSLESNNTNHLSLLADNKQDYKFNFRAGLITLPLIALSWNFFSEASDLSDAIKFAGSNDLPTSNLNKEKNRKSALGAICAATGLINFVLSFEEVEFKASPTSVGLGYGF